MARTLSKVFLAVALLLGTGCGGAKDKTSSIGSSALEKYENPQVTPETYEAIQVGDKFDDLKAKLGEPSETLFAVPDVNPLQLDGKPVDSIARWKHGSGEAMKELVVWVKDGLILEKGQQGLLSAPTAPAQ